MNHYFERSMMPTKIVSAEKISNVKISELPDGEYIGIWGGYEVIVNNLNGERYRFHTELGLRTPAAHCVVTIKDGVATVEV
jgi:hypothetical protein